jgi:hypothetical protein
MTPSPPPLLLILGKCTDLNPGGQVSESTALLNVSQPFNHVSVMKISFKLFVTIISVSSSHLLHIERQFITMHFVGLLAHCDDILVEIFCLHKSAVLIWLV